MTFDQVNRPCNTDPIHVRADRQVWVVKYDALPNVRAEFFSVYRAVAPVPAHRAPWSIDNRNVGNHPSLGAALAAAEQVPA